MSLLEGAWQPFEASQDGKCALARIGYGWIFKGDELEARLSTSGYYFFRVSVDTERIPHRLLIINEFRDPYEYGKFSESTRKIFDSIKLKPIEIRYLFAIDGDLLTLCCCSEDDDWPDSMESCLQSENRLVVRARRVPVESLPEFNIDDIEF
jgi:hypothetical protein